MLVNGTIGHSMFSFIYGFSGYNRRKMQHTMPFGLKNVGATYQCPMTVIFYEMSHDYLEDYANDIVIMSKKSIIM